MRVVFNDPFSIFLAKSMIISGRDVFGDLLLACQVLDNRCARSSGGGGNGELDNVTSSNGDVRESLAIERRVPLVPSFMANEQ